MPNQNHKETPLHRKCLTLGLLVLLAGCYPPSAVEQNWGNSVRNNMVGQMVNPQAGLNTSPPTGLTPQAAANEMESYNKSFTSEAQKSSQLTYGGSSGSQSGGASSGQ